jgi:hypothetical protein
MPAPLLSPAPANALPLHPSPLPYRSVTLAEGFEAEHEAGLTGTAAAAAAAAAAAKAKGRGRKRPAAPDAADAGGAASGSGGTAANEGAAAAAAAAAAAGPGGRIALFPDTVSERAQKHVRELAALARAGHEAACLFLVVRSDVARFAPCHNKDPAYAELLAEAEATGGAVGAQAGRWGPTAAAGAALGAVGAAPMPAGARAWGASLGRWRRRSTQPAHACRNPNPRLAGVKMVAVSCELELGGGGNSSGSGCSGGSGGGGAPVPARFVLSSAALPVHLHYKRFDPAAAAAAGAGS